MLSLFRSRSRRCFRSEAILHLDKVLIPDARFPTYQTQQPVLIDQLPLASSEKEILKKKGKPTCFHKETIGPFAIRIIGYHDRFHQMPVRIIFFLHNDQVCFAEYLFAPGKENQPEEILRLFCARYLPGETITDESFYIEDPNRHRIFFYFNGISISIRYVDPNCEEARDPRLIALFGGRSS